MRSLIWKLLLLIFSLQHIRCGASLIAVRFFPFLCVPLVSSDGEPAQSSYLEDGDEEDGETEEDTPDDSTEADDEDGQSTDDSDAEGPTVDFSRADTEESAAAAVIQLGDLMTGNEEDFGSTQKAQEQQHKQVANRILDGSEELPVASSEAQVHEEDINYDSTSEESPHDLYEVNHEQEEAVPDDDVEKISNELLRKHRDWMELKGVISVIVGAVQVAIKFVKSGTEHERGNALWMAGRQVILPIIMHDVTGDQAAKLDSAVIEIVQALPEHETGGKLPEKKVVEAIEENSIELYKKFLHDATDDEMYKHLGMIIKQLAQLLPPETESYLDAHLGQVETETDPASQTDEVSRGNLRGKGRVAKEKTHQEIQEEKRRKEELRHLYKLWDKDGDGKVSKDELLRFAKEIQAETTQRNVDMSLSLYDVNKDGLLTMEELGVLEHAGEDGADGFEVRRFKAADANKNGVLDHEELQFFFHPQSNSASLKVLVQQTFHDKDTNGDGKLTENEWSKHGEQSFAQLDKSGDGSLDLNEVMQSENEESKVQDAMTQLFKQTDQDHDGSFSYAEFEKAWSGNLARCHSSKDPRCYLSLWAVHREL